MENYNKEEKKALLGKALEALYALLGENAKAEMPSLENFKLVPVVAYHSTYHALQPRGHNLFSEGFISISVRLQDTFEKLLERMSEGATVLPRCEKKRMLLLVQAFLKMLDEWDEKYGEQRQRESKASFVCLVNNWSRCDPYDVLIVKERHKRMQELRELLESKVGKNKAREIFEEESARVGECLIAHLEAPTMDADVAAGVHHMLFMLTNYEPQFPVTDMHYVARVWGKAKELAAVKVLQESMELETLRAVLGGIAGAPVLALLDVCMEETKA